MMAERSGPVVLVVGASSGVGRACAEDLKDRGCHVYGGARRIAAEGEEAAGRDGGFMKLFSMDVRSEDSLRSGVQQVLSAEGGLDVLVYCAGYSLSGAVEDTSPGEAQEEFDTNFLGALRAYREVLPTMRRQGHGLIAVISSVAGFIPLPFQAMYSASKYALEAMTEAMRMEVAPFGVRVTMIEPGDIRTGFTAARKWTAEAGREGSAYADRCRKAVAAMEKSERAGPGPEVIARLLAALMKMKNPPARVVVGGQYKLVAFLKRIVSDRFLEYVLTKMYS